MAGYHAEIFSSIFAVALRFVPLPGRDVLQELQSYGCPVCWRRDASGRNRIIIVPIPVQDHASTMRSFFSAESISRGARVYPTY